MDKPVINFLGANTKEVREAAEFVFGKDSYDDTGRKDKNRGTLKLKPRFEESSIGIANAKSPPMTLGDPNLPILQSYSRILMNRKAGGATVYKHSGVLFKLLEPDEDGNLLYVMEMDNGQDTCQLRLTPLTVAAKRGPMGTEEVSFNNECYDAKYKVILDKGPDWMMYVYAKTKNKTWVYDTQTLNCHHVSSYLCSGVIATYREDMTSLQIGSEVASAVVTIDCIERNNKPVAQVGVKELIILLKNQKIPKRSRKKIKTADKTWTSN